MKKKVFFQVSIILYIGLTLFLMIMAADVYVIVEFFITRIHNTTSFDWAGLVASIGGFLFMGYTIIRISRNRIILEREEIFVPENWGSNKIQYETHIAYSKIQNIYIISSDKNSLNKKMRWVFTPMPYIIFDCNDGKQKAINVFYYSKKQIVKIIDESILRAKQLGNEMHSKTGTEIFSEFLALQKKK